MKALGYIVSVIGLIGLGASMIIEIRNFIFKFLGVTPFAINDNFLMIASLIIVAVGIFIVMKYSKKGGKGIKSGEEVPIYRGNKIVGYRRH